MSSAFLCGPTVFCSTGSVFATHVPVQPTGEKVHTQLSRFTQGESVVKMLLACLFCSRLGQETRQTRKGGLLPPAQLTPKCQGGGSTWFPWKPSLSNIWFWSAERLWSDPYHCVLLSRWQYFVVTWLSLLLGLVFIPVTWDSSRTLKEILK